MAATGLIKLVQFWHNGSSREKTKKFTKYFLHCGSHLEVIYVLLTWKYIYKNLISCPEKYSHLTALKLNYVWRGDTCHIIKNIVRYYLLSLPILLLGQWNVNKQACFAARKNVVKISLKFLRVWRKQTFNLWRGGCNHISECTKSLLHRITNYKPKQWYSTLISTLLASLVLILWEYWHHLCTLCCPLWHNLM